jgi:CBS domain-containing protein
MEAKDIMTQNPTCAYLDDSLENVAQKMRDSDCGSIPVVDEGYIVGIVTDRDLAVRGFAKGRGPSAKVSEVMTAAPACCTADADLQEVTRTMTERQVRRVPVVDADGCCIGIVAQADLARAAERSRVSEHDIAVVVERISEPVSVSRSRDAEVR